jgi:phosphoserine phosphatase RsbU/P
MAFLTAISGSGFGKQYTIEKPVTVLGRHPDCDVVIDVGAVSRQHAKIHRNGGGTFELEDLKSRNHTYVNGQMVNGRLELADGDLIRICDAEFSFHCDVDGANPFFGSTHMAPGDGSSFGILMVDDQEVDSSSRVQSKLDIRNSSGGSQLTSSTEMRLQAVLEITHNLARAVQLEDVLPKVLDTLFKVFMQADRAFIVLRQGEELVPRWIKTRQAEQQETFRISRTVMREVMESKEAIISLDATSDERFDMATSIADFRIRSMIVAPLLDSGGEPLGAIQMDTLDSKRRFAKEDLEVLAGIATQAGVAIENAQLHEELMKKQDAEKDLELARSVQQAFLPARDPGTTGYDFYHYYLPAEQVGGDYFDYIELTDGRLAIVVADVAGHGVASALLMAKLSAETRYLLASQSNPATAMTMLNRVISSLGVQKFVTMLCLVIEPATGLTEIVNAGHMPPLWIKRGGRIEQPGDEAAGVPLNVLDDFEYDLATIELAPGDGLVLYTDGIHEAPSAQGIQFGLPRLQTLASGPCGDIKAIGERIICSVQQFTHGTSQEDDMCLVIIGRNPA